MSGVLTKIALGSDVMSRTRANWDELLQEGSSADAKCP